MVDHYKKACKVKNNPSRYVHVPGVIELFGIYPLGTIRDDEPPASWAAPFAPSTGAGFLVASVVEIKCQRRMLYFVESSGAPTFSNIFRTGD